MRILRICCCLAAVGCVQPAFGETGLYAGMQRLKWVETAPGGGQLVKESGTIYSLGSFWNQDVAAGRGFSLRGKAFFGQVGYDGQTWGGTPVSTNTDYLGGEVEGRVFYRVPFSGWRADFFAAGGYRLWVRDIESTQSALGYAELWRMPYAGLGLSAEAASGFYGEAMAGAPFSVRNKAYLSDAGADGDVTLNPKGKFMLALEAGYRYRNLTLSAYYSQIRFGASDFGTAFFGGAPVAVFQPESREESYGLRASYRF